METTNRIDVLVRKVAGGEIRLIGEYLPKLAAHLEHRTYCVACDSSGRVALSPRENNPARLVRGHDYCDACDGEGFAPIADGCEGPCDCSLCLALEHICQPGGDQDLRYLTDVFETPPDREAELYARYPELAPRPARKPRMTRAESLARVRATNLRLAKVTG